MGQAKRIRQRSWIIIGNKNGQGKAKERLIMFLRILQVLVKIIKENIIHEETKLIVTIDSIRKDIEKVNLL